MNQDISSMPVGTELTYFGVKMIVARAIKYSPPIPLGLFWHEGWPSEIIAEYLDARGVIREKSFTGAQLDMLLARV